MNICIKIRNEFETIEITPLQLIKLERMNTLGETFIKLGYKNYNVNMIEYWYPQNAGKGDNSDD